MQLLLHPKTRHIVERLTAQLPQGVLLSGVAGIGLHTIAQQIASAQGALILEPTTREAVTLGIDMIRELYDQLRTNSGRQRIVIIDEAERLTTEAQNAFLKLLEEPDDSTHFLLTSHAPQLLLPTIRSRVQQFYLPPPIHSPNLMTTFISHADSVKQLQINFMAPGLPAESIRLANNDDYFLQASEAMKAARDFLEKDTYQKLLLIHRYSAERKKALLFTQALQVLLRHSLHKAPSAVLAQKLATLLDIEERLRQNGHAKTQLLQLLF